MMAQGPTIYRVTLSPGRAATCNAFCGRLDLQWDDARQPPPPVEAKGLGEDWATFIASCEPFVTRTALLKDPYCWTAMLIVGIPALCCREPRVVGPQLRNRSGRAMRSTLRTARRSLSTRTTCGGARRASSATRAVVTPSAPGSLALPLSMAAGV